MSEYMDIPLRGGKGGRGLRKKISSVGFLKLKCSDFAILDHFICGCI